MNTDEREVSETANKNKVRPDTILKTFWRDNEHFADLFNAALFGGEQSVRILWRKRMGQSIFVKGHAGDSRENKTAGI